MPFKDIDAFENYLESIDEQHDEGSVVITEVDIFVETGRKTFNRVKSSENGKGSKNIEKKES